MFQSTRPVWGATPLFGLDDALHFVSIHAPRVGRDNASLLIWACISCFNPRAPCGARRSTKMASISPTCFNPRAPCGARRKRGHDFPPLPRIYGYSPPQIRFSRHLRPTPLLRHDSRTYIFTFCFLFTSPSHSVMNAQMMMTASKS